MATRGMAGQADALAVMSIAPDGRLGSVQQRLALPGQPGRIARSSRLPSRRFNPFSPDGRFVLVPDKGQDRIFIFAFEHGRLAPAPQPWLDCREGSGPRHMAFHPALACAYVVNELDNTVLTCRFDAATGALQGLQILSTLPERFVGNSRAAGIEVLRDGRQVLVSNRGADGIAVFDVDPLTGLLHASGGFASGGRTPRFFTSSPDGRLLYVLNEDSRTASSAMPRMTPRRPLASTHCASPVCMVFAR